MRSSYPLLVSSRSSAPLLAALCMAASSSATCKHQGDRVDYNTVDAHNKMGMCSHLGLGSTLHVHSSVPPDHIKTQDQIFDRAHCENAMPHMNRETMLGAIGVVKAASNPRCNARDSSPCAPQHDLEQCQHRFGRHCCSCNLRLKDNRAHLCRWVGLYTGYKRSCAILVVPRCQPKGYSSGICRPFKYK